MKKILIDDETWTGGYFELAIELGPTPDHRVDHVIAMLWQYPLIEHMDDYGIALLPEHRRVVFRIFHVPEEDGQDWLICGMPFGSLAKVYDLGGYPFGATGDSTSHEWRKPVESWLTELGRYIYADTPYRLGLIGFEVSGDVYASDIEINGVPDERWINYLWPVDGKLTVYSVNKWEPPFTFS